MFIWNSTHKVRIPLAQIKSIGESGYADKSMVRTLSGDEYLVADHEIESAQSTAIALIPAAAGFSIIHEYVEELAEETPERFFRAPIIAWGLTRDGEMRPFTASGDNDLMYRSMPIETPQGVVVEPNWQQEFPDVEAYLRECVRQRDARAAGKARADG
jgi:hypothetical protein